MAQVLEEKLLLFPSEKELAKALQGKYIVFDFSADYTIDQGAHDSALAVFQIVEDTLQEAWHPCSTTVYNTFNIETNEKAIAFLKARKVKEVYSLNQWTPPASFLGQVLDFDEGKNAWYLYEPLYDEYWKHFFAERGLALRLVSFL